ncbi:hypothetical protein CHUAL_004349 [Chamberlinius hualienensis]
MPRMVDFRCCKLTHINEKVKDDGLVTTTSALQVQVESSVDDLYKFFRNKISIDPESPLLRRESHAAFLRKGLIHLSDAYECLDASRPWLCYWILHSLSLLGEAVSDTVSSGIVRFLNTCQHPDGGFGGGPCQIPHLAPTYAAVNALCILGTEEAFNCINREKLYAFLKGLKQPDGSFPMHIDGEVDIRGVYCALSVAKLTNIYTDELFDQSAQWVVRCQTYEGGFGGVPGMEAHGGYSFCGLASLSFLKKQHLCDIQALLRWTANRQMRFEGGFQGRTNKLVDGCYSFWQGGVFPLVHYYLLGEDSNNVDMKSWMFHQGALQEYLLICCQSASGGLIDKPGKHRDFYHTCYTLCGLSIAQHFGGGNIGSTYIIGDTNNELLPIYPLYNIGVEVAANAVEYFSKLPSVPN